MSLSAELTKLAKVLLDCSIALDAAIDDVRAHNGTRKDDNLRKWRHAGAKARAESDRLRAAATAYAKLQSRGAEVDA